MWDEGVCGLISQQEDSPSHLIRVKTWSDYLELPLVMMVLFCQYIDLLVLLLKNKAKTETTAAITNTNTDNALNVISL